MSKVYRNKPSKAAISEGRNGKAAKRNIFSFTAADKRDGNEKRFY